MSDESGLTYHVSCDRCGKRVKLNMPYVRVEGPSARAIVSEDLVRAITKLGWRTRVAQAIGTEVHVALGEVAAIDTGDICPACIAKEPS